LGKLRILSGKEVCDILVRHGFSEVRQRGSHIVMEKKLSDTTITEEDLGKAYGQVFLRASSYSRSQRLFVE
jgi:predicted RNA binding protein YcfA (HicA-like mRNA interferase family)